jgi:hypothetical protein
MKHFISIASALMVVAPSALATDYYVDAVNGNDASAGTSPATAWKTIVHASAASAQDATSTIHLAPGTYSTASGETFPLFFHGQNVVGDAGPASTVIDAGGAIAIEMHQIGPGQPSNMLSSLTGVTGRNAQIFAHVSTAYYNVSTSFSGVRFENVSGACIDISGSNPPSTGFGFTLTLDHVDCSLAHSTTLVVLRSNTGHGVLTASDCDFSNATGDAVLSDSAFLVDATFERCRFTHDVGAAFHSQNDANGFVFATFRDCLMAHCGSGLLQVTSDPTTGCTQVLERCTIAHNSGFGIRNVGPQSIHTAIDTTIVFGNGTDVQASAVTFNSSWVTAGDPLFVDPPSDDYRLRFGSPCIDLGHPGSGSGAPDLAGVVRPIDGNLDTIERADIGAYEFTPLRLVTSGHLGTPLRLESSGPTGGTSTMYFTRGAPVTPMSTPFGEFDLNPSTFGTLLHTNIAPFPPVAFQRPIPNLPFLVGHTFSFQGLTTSALAPQGSAYTNVVSFTVLP